MHSVSLIAHPAKPGKAITHIDVDVVLLSDSIRTVFRARGDIGALSIPSVAPACRADGLWRSTCCELFLEIDAPAYFEFNFSPSTAWAAYRFDNHREGMKPFAAQAPSIAVTASSDTLTLESRLHLPELNLSPARCGPTCVIAERDGTLSYWAMTHGSPAPDFHDSAVRGIVL